MDRAGGDEGSGGEYVGDSPGEPFELPDEPVAVDKPGVTAEEQRERSLERRLAMDEPETGQASSERPAVPILDDDVATEDVVTEDPEVDPETADLDRTEQEAGERSFEPAEAAEESAMHVEPE